MALTVNSTVNYARRYVVTRDSVIYHVDIDLRALWRPLDVGSYRVTRVADQARIAAGPWALGVSGPEVAEFFTGLLDASLGGSHALAVNSTLDYAAEHDVTYNAGSPSERELLIRLDTLANRRVVLEKSTGNAIDSGRWGVAVTQGADVQAFFEQMIHAITGVAPI